jgi:hypothetical protein
MFLSRESLPKNLIRGKKINFSEGGWLKSNIFIGGNLKSFHSWSGAALKFSTSPPRSHFSNYKSERALNSPKSGAKKVVKARYLKILRSQARCVCVYVGGRELGNILIWKLCPQLFCCCRCSLSSNKISIRRQEKFSIEFNSTLAVCTIKNKRSCLFASRCSQDKAHLFKLKRRGNGIANIVEVEISSRSAVNFFLSAVNLKQEWKNIIIDFLVIKKKLQ